MHTLKGKMLVWFGAALLLLLSISGLFIFMEVKNTVFPLVKEMSKEILVARSAEMSRLVDGYSNEIRTISRLDIIRQGDFEDVAAYLTGIENEINPDYEMIFFANLEGDFITTSSIRGNIGDREYFRAIIFGGSISFISDPMISRSTGEEIFVVAWAVFDDNEDKIGVLASTVLMETLSDIAAEISIGQSGFGYIVDQSGLLIAHPNKELRMSLNFLDSGRFGYMGLEEIGQEMVSGGSGVMTYNRPGGEKLISAFNPIPHTPGWSLGVALYEEELLGTASDLMQDVVLTMALFAIGMLLLVYYLSGRLTRPILALTDGVRTVSAGNLDQSLSIKTGDEIEELAAAYNKMTTDLKEYIRNLKQTTAEKERIESELQVANKIQSSMLPRTFPPYPDIENLGLYAIMEPAREVGGDFYDFFPLDKSRFCFCIGDVSGKGIPAALFMVITRTILKNQTLQGAALARIFDQANNLLCSDNAEGMFVTVFMGILDTKKGEVEYVCAGHNPPLIARKGEECQFLDVKRNFVLGGMEDYSYQSQRISLNSGDLLLLYTDGVNEAMNQKGELYGDERFITAVNSSLTKRPQTIIEAVTADVGRFVKDTPASDDLTMLALTLLDQDAG